MAFVLKLGVKYSDNCYSIKCIDVSGINGINSNETGWNTDGVTIALASAATIAITLPDGTAIAPINVFSILPNTSGSPFTITNVMLGLSSTDLIPSGAWHFVYTVTVSGTPYVFSGDIFLACAEWCCVQKSFSKKRDCKCKKNDCGCISIWDEYQSMLSSASCGKINEANEKLLRVQSLCAQSGCGCS